jgi:hypothetical protein
MLERTVVSWRGWLYAGEDGCEQERMVVCSRGCLYAEETGCIAERMVVQNARAASFILERSVLCC